MSEKREQIIESATRMIRTGGYNAFSFREIADEVGVKSSSVHHYFRRKENLALIVAERYSEAFFHMLGRSKDHEGIPRSIIDHYGNVFIEAFKASGKACLCGILTHQSPAVPSSVLGEVETFVDRNIIWLTESFRTGPELPDEGQAIARGRLIYSALTSAMAVATLKSDVGWLISVKAELIHCMA